MSTTESRQSSPITIFTIGFTRRSAQEFFCTLKSAKVTSVIDIRLNNTSQLAGFTKKTDLPFFLHELADIEYVHHPDLAPTPELLSAYHKHEISWCEYEERFLDLISRRHIESVVTCERLNNACLLCSEATPEHCHRRLVAEYLKEKWDNVNIVHL